MCAVGRARLICSAMLSRTSWRRAVSLIVVWSVAESLRIPENPCPEVFSYYRTRENGDVYGEAYIPFDGSNSLRFSVNGSLLGYFTDAKLRIQLANRPTAINQKYITYNIYFPFQYVIPKITELMYNEHIYCSGPPEPLLPGSSGVTDIWARHRYSFTTQLRTSQPGPDNNAVVTVSSSISDKDLPIKDPVSVVNLSNSSSPSFKDNPFLNTAISSGSAEVATDKRCGIANNLAVPLIIGGSETREGQYPWLAALFSYNTERNNYEYRCAANLISSRHVMTAARCVQYYSIQVVKTEDILLVLGKNDLTHWATNGAITRGAAKVQAHPYFKENSKSAHGDVAVITLNEPIQVSKTIRPVCLWEGNQDLDSLVDQKGTLAAWGADVNSKEKAELVTLKANHVEIPIASQFDCLKSDKIFRNLTSEMTFCAGAKDGRGPCVGDSGAGFVIPKDGIFFLRGIASIAAPSKKDGLCDLSKYTIFCDVAKFGDWVKSCMED